MGDSAAIRHRGSRRADCLRHRLQRAVTVSPFRPVPPKGGGERAPPRGTSSAWNARLTRHQQANQQPVPPEGVDARVVAWPRLPGPSTAGSTADVPRRGGARSFADDAAVRASQGADRRRRYLTKAARLLKVADATGLRRRSHPDAPLDPPARQAFRDVKLMQDAG
ncbi:hypothetical protein ACHZ98_20850 [Streptomyces sp. MAR4 CNY-716]